MHCSTVPFTLHTLECCSYAILAGIYVGFGSFLAFTVGANLQEMAATNPGLQKFLYGAIGLPAGLVMVCLHMTVSVIPSYMYQQTLGMQL